MGGVGLGAQEDDEEIDEGEWNLHAAFAGGYVVIGELNEEEGEGGARGADGWRNAG
eukprot:CAMPEP_0175077970 /NCGR_PEP_ID=MMETSP0052_2-20121109/23778_1 /TAXON_ID=51329 ORGANISM="Polytomella parva, Strain SAG 63-3" /NCGR_SAMPLE_ID=MMETSP0052_2 /ASSEMBLY_ACC=CAM_ASM_000194 /LENGTH=55 /DNA_ID=CAMNT_0016347679 /DNA_START=125 /DNA_END=292 /DNA_ORIENTATION=+